MRDILKLHEQSKIYQLLFSTFEQEVIQLLNSIPADEKCYAILNKKIYQRFTKLCPALKDNPKVMMYKKSVNELNHDDHPLRQHYKKETVANLLNSKLRGSRNKLDVANRSFMLTADMMIDGNDLFGLYILEASVALSDDKYLTKTAALVKEHLVGWTTSKLAEYYLKLANEVSLKDTATSSATTLGETAAKDNFNEKIECLIWRIICNANVPELSHLLGVFLDIGTMNQEQIEKFVCGYYSNIPCIGSNLKPTAAASIRKTFSRNPYYEKHVAEYFAKGERVIAHIIVDFDFHEILEFSVYDVSEKETVNLFGQDYCMDEDFLEGMHLDLFLMVTCDYKNVKVITDFTFDYQKSLAISMTQDRDAGLYEYLLDMEGRYHRLKQS